MEFPLVSVIMPVYNGAKYLDFAIESVLKQNYTNWELLVIDDGSEDGSLEKIINWLNIDNRIKYLYHPNHINKGVSATRNLGINQSNGKYIAFLDCDDLWNEDKLEIQIPKFIEDPSLIIVYSKAISIDDDGIELKISQKYNFPIICGNGNPGKSENIFELLVADKCWVPCLTVVARKDVILEFGGFNENFELQIEDHYLFTLLSTKGPVYFCEELLAKYRVHNNSYTMTNNWILSMFEYYLYLIDELPHFNDLIKKYYRIFLNNNIKSNENLKINENVLVNIQKNPEQEKNIINKNIQQKPEPINKLNIANDNIKNKELSSIISIIIPTYNRASSLVKAIKSIYTFNASIKDKFEVIVVDNGSTDQTAIICAEIKKKVNNFVYIYEPVPGLLSGRHAGANVAKGEILTFVDDDIEITEKWLESIIEIFDNPNIHLAGGPTLPIFESDFPEWILYYFQNYDVKKGTGYLSLKNREITDEYVDPNEIWGLNFSIRNKTFFKSGGFHPDNIKKELQYFQGDGESGLTIKLRDMNYLAFYSENIKVFHNVYNNRMTPEYFQERAFYQGICDSFTQLKNKKVLDKIVFPVGFNRTIPTKFNQYTSIYTKVHQYYVYGFYYHQYACVKSDIVYNWVLKEDYFDYQLPQVPLEFHNEMVHLRNNLHLLDKIINSQ